MHARCMDAADDKRVQPIKVLLVATLPVPLVIEMSTCLLSPAPRRSATPLGSIVGKCSQLRQSTTFRIAVLCTSEKPRL